MAPDEERALADIEKLIKRSLVRVPFRIQHSPRGGATAIDDWFYKPYEPTATTAPGSESVDSSARRFASSNLQRAKVTRAVGALLGGTKKADA
jgi:hypothetical protein